MSTTVRIPPATRTYDIRQYVQTGEHLLSDGSGVGDNIAIIQRAVLALNALYAVDNVPRQIFFPDGTYLLAQAGTHGSVPYCVRWYSGVGISTTSRRGVIFQAPASCASVFVADAEWGLLTDVYCSPHVVDGGTGNPGIYHAYYKAWFIQGLTDFVFDDVLVMNTWATGWGCDYLRKGPRGLAKVTGVAVNCGRGIPALSIDPLTTSGGSGFGVGTGHFEFEDVDMDVVAIGCGFHGVFFETQPNQTYTQTKGARVRAKLSGNYVGFRDCGCDGLQAEITTLGNTYAEILHDQTILNTVMGINGNVRVSLSKGAADGIVIGTAITRGPYRFWGTVRDMGGKGVKTKASATIPNKLTLDLDIFGCASHGVYLDQASTDLTLKIRSNTAHPNGTYDIALIGSGNSATDLNLLDCDLRGSGFYLEQTLAGEVKVSTTVRGIATSDPSRLIATTASSTSVNLTWTKPLQTSDITDYSIQYRLYGAGTWSTFSHTASTDNNATVTGLSQPNLYDFRVAANRSGVLSNYTQTTASMLLLDQTAPTYADFFTVGSDTSIAGRTLPDGSNTSKTWTVAGGSGVITAKAVGQYASVTTGTSRTDATISAASADGVTQCTIPVLRSTTPQGFFLYSRYGDTNNNWAISINTSGAYTFRKRVASVSTAVPGFSGPLAAAGDKVALFTVGTTIAFILNDALLFVAPTDNTALASNTGRGFGLDKSVDSATSVDNVKVW